MEKKRNISWPAKAKTMSIMSETTIALTATLERSAGDRFPDIDMNTGITPSGFMRLKKEVKTITLNSNTPMFFCANLYFLAKH